MKEQFVFISKAHSWAMIAVDAVKSIVEDLNFKGIKLNREDLGVIDGLGISRSMFSKRILRIDKVKLVDPLGIPFSHPKQCFNTFGFETQDCSRSISLMHEHYNSTRRTWLGEFWPLHEEDVEKPASFYVYGMPWVSLKLYERETLSKNPKTNFGNHYWGPLDSIEIENEAARFSTLYNSFLERSHNSLTDRFKRIILRNHRYISGFLLVKDNDYRFMVLSGKHRAHVIQRVNQDLVWVRLDPRFFPVVFESSLFENSLESLGIFKQGATERIVREVFAKEKS
jgi:hypothetical protein